MHVRNLTASSKLLPPSLATAARSHAPALLSGRSFTVGQAYCKQHVVCALQHLQAELALLMN
jgi:hypothetical protein